MYQRSAKWRRKPGLRFYVALLVALLFIAWIGYALASVLLGVYVDLWSWWVSLL